MFAWSVDGLDVVGSARTLVYHRVTVVVVGWRRVGSVDAMVVAQEGQGKDQREEEEAEENDKRGGTAGDDRNGGATTASSSRTVFRDFCTAPLLRSGERVCLAFVPFRWIRNRISMVQLPWQPLVHEFRILKENTHMHDLTACPRFCDIRIVQSVL